MSVPQLPDDRDDRDVVLVPAVRARVVALAADVLTRMPADKVPVTLRAIARFAPTKRARLGGVAIAAALDSDEIFRVAVAEVVSASVPVLATAVRDGEPTAASDPVDVAVIAYLTRPTGWEQVVASACARWLDEHADADAARQEVDGLRAEIADLRAAARGESERIRVAVQAAVADSAAELIELRKTVRARTGELRAAESAVAAGQTEIDQARAALDEELARVGAVTEAELRRHRERVAELERSAGTSRRESRVGRDIDEARLWLLTDTLMQAAAGVRRELSIAAPTLRPADGVAAGPTTGGARSLRDAAELDRVLALPNVHLVVDGYNVTKTGYGDLPLIDQRERLIGALAPLVAQTGAEVTIAFDGAARPPVQPATPRGVRVLFSAQGEIADDLIRRLVAAEPQGRPVVVVTSDRQVVTDVSNSGAWSVPSVVLLARMT